MEWRDTRSPMLKLAVGAATMLIFGCAAPFFTTPTPTPNPTATPRPRIELRATPTPTPIIRGSSINGWQLIEKTLIGTENSILCPESKVIVSGGYETLEKVERSGPLFNNRGWQIRTATPGKITGWAICAFITG